MNKDKYKEVYEVVEGGGYAEVDVRCEICEENLPSLSIYPHAYFGHVDICKICFDNIYTEVKKDFKLKGEKKCLKKTNLI